MRLQQSGCFLRRDAAVAGDRVHRLAVQHAERDGLQLGTFVGELLLAQFDSTGTVFIDKFLHRASGDDSAHLPECDVRIGALQHLLHRLVAA